MKIAQQDTAISAYHKIVPQLRGEQNTRILRYIESVRQATISEISYWTGIDKSSVSRAQNELRADGLLEWGPERKSEISGVTCKTLRLPVRQMELC